MESVIKMDKFAVKRAEEKKLSKWRYFWKNQLILFNAYFLTNKVPAQLMSYFWTKDSHFRPLYNVQGVFLHWASPKKL